jgi:hypothetical protein
MKHTIKTDAQTGVKSLHRDNYPLNCPFRAPMAVPGQLAGQIAIMSTPCNSTCPLFCDDGIGKIKLFCSAQVINYGSTDFSINN